MILPLLLMALAQSAPDSLLLPEGPGYRGSERELSVALPRVEDAAVRVDGDLSEPAWANAARLSGFTQVEPAEGRPASERTEVRVFYTPDALFVGVHAFAREPARVRATLANRDRIERDDRVQVLLDTFDDRRRAYSFAFNPLGIQQDGIYNEAAGGRRREERLDLSPDFIYESKGRVTEDGYVVEARIPLKSIKFAPTAKRWGLNVVREIAATGEKDAWAPISRNNPSQLAQSGSLAGIHDLRPGRLLELNPVITGKRNGAPDEAGRFTHEAFQPDFGMNAKYGLTSNLTLDATYNPDFSQVEADAGQITTNERFAIFFPEKRPFFLEGADLFTTPEPLVYTRSIISPVAGAKLTGKVGAMNLGYLGALDESPLGQNGTWLAPDPSRALFNVARLQTDVGSGSSLGALVTDREAIDQYNRVGGVDGRVRFGKVYSWQFQAARSWTRQWARSTLAPDSAPVDGARVGVAPADLAGHLVSTAVDRSGRGWGFRLQGKDIPADFRAQTGFIRRVGVTDLLGVLRVTRFGKPGARLESWGPYFFVTRIYGGRDFWNGGAAQEGDARVRFGLNFRGNNRLALSYGNGFFRLEPGRYSLYSLVDGAGVPRTGSDLVAPLRNLRGLNSFAVEGSSAYFKSLSVETELRAEQTPIFAEGTLGTGYSARGQLEMRPTDALRVEATLNHARLYRAADHSLYSRATLPRLKVEYQLNRAVFLRAVGQYSVEQVDLLRAPDGTPYLYRGQPLRLRGGLRSAAGLPQTNPLRADLLFAYQPSPGTVVFLGYGREMNDRGAYRFSPLEPRADGLFLKLSYLFRS